MEGSTKMLIRCILAVFWLSLVIPSILCELRFCQWGPQRVKNSDCPYGVFFKAPVSTSCIFYANDGTGPTADSEVISCAKAVTLSASGEKTDMKQFSAAFMDVADANDKGEKGMISNQCQDECMSQWRDFDDRNDVGGARVDPPEESEEYKEYLPEEQPDLERNRNLTAQLFIYLIDESNEIPQVQYMRTTRLFKLSLEIMRTICQPFITPEFMDQIYRGFLFMVGKTEDPINDLGDYEYTVLMEHLKNCKGAEKPRVLVHGIDCNNYTRITSYGNPGSPPDSMTKYKIKAKSFRWDKYDPFIEGAWAAVDFVHGYCLPTHLPDFNFHHIYELGMEALFTKLILQRWNFAPTLKSGDSYWNNILQAKNARIMMQNMDACAQAGYFGSVYKDRLNRPFNKFYDDLSGPPPDGIKPRDGAEKSGGKKSGWDTANGEYWAWYDSNDALNQYLQKVGGTCLKTEDDLNTARASQDAACSK